MRLRDLLNAVARGELSVDEAEKLIKLNAIEEILSVARFDIGRELRRSVPEIVYARSKPTDVLLEIVKRVVDRCGRVIVSKLRRDQIEPIRSLSSEYDVHINEIGRIAVVKRKGFSVDRTGGRVAVLCGGTADIPIAEEAKTVAEELGCEVLTLYDVGIASPIRAINAAKKVIEFDADVAIVVAGMEGALPTFIASLLDIPVIAVPVSCGYGAGGRGRAALLAMLQSCALGVAVVNIDNGVGAGVIAALIANRVARYRSSSR